MVPTTSTVVPSQKNGPPAVVQNRNSNLEAFRRNIHDRIPENPSRSRTSGLPVTTAGLMTASNVIVATFIHDP